MIMCIDFANQDLAWLASLRDSGHLVWVCYLPPKCDAIALPKLEPLEPIEMSPLFLAGASLHRTIPLRILGSAGDHRDVPLLPQTLWMLKVTSGWNVLTYNVSRPFLPLEAATPLIAIIHALAFLCTSFPSFTHHQKKLSVVPLGSALGHARRCSGEGGAQ